MFDMIMNMRNVEERNGLNECAAVECKWFGWENVADSRKVGSDCLDDEDDGWNKFKWNK